MNDERNENNVENEVKDEQLESKEIKIDPSLTNTSTSIKKKKMNMTKTGRKYLIYIGILVIVSALAVYFVIKQDPIAVFNALGSCDIKWILASIGVILLAFLVEGLIMTILARMYKLNFPFYKGVLNTMIGVFFSGITPSNSGGQFAQAYTFSKQGVKITNAASILFMHFILYQAVLVIFSSVVMVFKFNEMRALTQTIDIFGFHFDIIVLAIIGFIINVSVIVGLFFLAYSKRIHKILVKYVIGLLAKLHLIKHKDDTILKLNTKVETFRIEFKRLSQNWKVLLVTSFLFFVKMVLLNCVPYFIAKGISGVEFASENEFYNFVNATSMTTLVSTITAMVPIPGASGGAEIAFSYMFGGSFFKHIDSSQISALVLLWRAITFYLGLILGFIVFVSYHESPKEESFLHGDARTLLEINIINLNGEEVSKKRVKEESSIMHIEPKLLTVEDIEAHFAALKDDLQEQLTKNEESVYSEPKEKRKKRDK